MHHLRSIWIVFAASWLVVSLPPAKAGDEILEATYTADTESTVKFIADNHWVGVKTGAAAGTYRSAVMVDPTRLPPGTVTKVQLRINVSGIVAGHQTNVWPLNNNPRQATPAGLHTDANDDVAGEIPAQNGGAAFLAGWAAFQVPGVQTVDLGAAAAASITNARDAGRRWWAVGLESATSDMNAAQFDGQDDAVIGNRPDVIVTIRPTVSSLSVNRLNTVLDAPTTITINGNNFEAGGLVIELRQGAAVRQTLASPTFVSKTKVTGILDPSLLTAEANLDLRVTITNGGTSTGVDNFDLDDSSQVAVTAVDPPGSLTTRSPRILIRGGGFMGTDLGVSTQAFLDADGVFPYDIALQGETVFDDRSLSAIVPSGQPAGTYIVVVQNNAPAANSTGALFAVTSDLLWIDSFEDELDPASCGTKIYPTRGEVDFHVLSSRVLTRGTPQLTSVSVRQVGSAPAPGLITATVYISNDPHFDATDTLFGSTVAWPGQVATVGGTFTGAVDDTYFVLVLLTIGGGVPAGPTIQLQIDDPTFFGVASGVVKSVTPLPRTFTAVPVSEAFEVWSGSTADGTDENGNLIPDYATIQAAEGAAQGAPTASPVTIAIGDNAVYNEIVTVDGGAYLADSPLVLRAWRGFTPTINGGDARRCGVTVRDDYVTIAHLKFTDFANATNYSAAIEIDGNHDLAVRDCWIDAKSDHGILIGFRSAAPATAVSNDVVVERCALLNAIAAGADAANRGDAIHIMSGSRRLRVSNCVFYEYVQSGIHYMTGDADEIDSRLRNNVFLSSSATAVAIKVVDPGSQTGFDSDHNCCRLSGAAQTGQWGATGCVTLADWRAGRDTLAALEASLAATPDDLALA